MQDKELYRQLMGLREPWGVSEVKVDFDGLKVDVWVEWPPEGPAPCPECGATSAIYDHREERQWRHSGHHAVSDDPALPDTEDQLR